MRNDRHGRVLFIDGDMWEPFGQLAAALARHGIASDHLTVPPRHWQGRYAHVLERSLFHRTATPVRRAVADGGHAQIDLSDVARYVSPDTIDIQVRDDLGYSLLNQGATGLPGLDQRSQLQPGAAVYDKWVMTQVAAAAEVPVPRTWPVAEFVAHALTSGDAASIDSTGTSSWTAMIKTRVGFGGQGVVRLTQPAQLPAITDTLRQLTGAEPFVQEFLGTEMINVGGVAVHGDVLLAASYRPLPPSDDPHGPPVAITLTAHPQAVESARRLVSAVGYHGMFTIDFVCDAAGRAHFIDFNPRVFGAWAALQSLGVDVLGAYLAMLGVGSRTQPMPLPVGQRATTLGPPPRMGDLRRWWAGTRATIDAWRPWLGRRWATQARARAAGLATRELTRRLTERRY